MVASAQSGPLTIGGYFQIQYFNTDRIGATRRNLVEIRRARLNLAQKLNDTISGKFSVEFAEGSNRDDTRIKDAFLDFDLSKEYRLHPLHVIVGQQNVPLGIDIERSDSVREFPERAAYNRALFPGERSRGLVVRSTLSKTLQAGFGILNAITVNDPEQMGKGIFDVGRFAGVGYLRGTKGNLTLGVSGLLGGRPSFTSGGDTSPSGDRYFVYGDAEYRLNKAAFLRAEGMIGRDRVGSATASPTRVDHSVSGFQIHAGYNFDPKNQINARWEQFDTNLDAGASALNGYAASFQHTVNNNTKVVLAHEIFTDESRVTGKRYGQTTLRLQVKF